MDARRFEELSRKVGAAQTRRDAVRAAVAALGLTAFGIGAAERAEASEAEGIPIYHCKIPGWRCKKGKSCCSGKCKQGVCTCAAKGKPCYEPMEGSLCCSGRCKKGKCK